MTPKLHTASLSDVGRKRRNNQDHCGEFNPGVGRLMVCCDGMGGHKGGEVASQLAVETIGASFAEADGNPAERLHSAFEAAHDRVQLEARTRPELHGMGTTGVVLYYDGEGAAWIAHVGDSRAYLLRDGAIRQLTDDHSIIAELLRAGRITPEQAALHPHNELSRAIGASDGDVHVDCARHDALDGDRFLLCSDGLWNLVQDREIAEVLAHEDPASAVRTLVARANERGGTDNVTVQVLGLGESRGILPADPDATEHAANAALAFAKPSAREGQAETQAVSLADVDVNAIWAQAQRDASAKRDRRLRAALVGAAVIATLLLGALLWLGGLRNAGATLEAPSDEPAVVEGAPASGSDQEVENRP